ncbi:MAG: CapA family protein, partial [Candidatus Omnitrophica bacterium]|nr:CapA family protein [Candidatus Omnitrophota bacterium]
AAVGDVNFGADFPDCKIPPEEKRDHFKNCEKILKAADISFCNLETVLGEKKSPAKKIDGRHSFVFRCPGEFGKVISEAGFDVVSIANNHIRDFGKDGENETKRILDENKIQFVSREGEIAQFNIRGLKVIFSGYSFGPGKRSITNSDNVFAEIRNLSQMCDVLVVSFHAGSEGENAMYVRNQTEYFLGENRGNVVHLAHGAIDNGADLVLMHGPHVPRAVEVYRDRFIAYSLGNFVNYGWSLKKSAKIAPLLWIELTFSGRPVCVKFYSFVQNRSGYPEFDTNHTAYRIIAKLTREGFDEKIKFFNLEE